MERALVNSNHVDPVHRGDAVSAQGITVLRALAATVAREYGRYYDNTPAIIPAGQLAVADLVEMTRHGVSLNVRRASLSRTLRRLWRAGLVELSSGYTTMTGMRDAALETLAEQEADPAAAYKRYKATVKSLGMPDRHGSAQVYMLAMREKAHARQDLRITEVQITTAGRARLTSHSCSEVNRLERAG